MDKTITNFCLEWYYVHDFPLFTHAKFMPASGRALSTKRAEGFPSLECPVLNAISTLAPFSSWGLREIWTCFDTWRRVIQILVPLSTEHGHRRAPPVALRNDSGYVKKHLINFMSEALNRLWQHHPRYNITRTIRRGVLVLRRST